MIIPELISFRRPGKNARKIVATFPSTTVSMLPDIILVGGTEDFRRLNKESRQWVSRCKYSSLELSLQFLDFTPNGVIIETASYDKSGKRIINPSQNAVISTPVAKVDPQTLIVGITWTSEIELGVQLFTVNKEVGGNDLGPIKEIAAKGTGSIYNTADESQERGTFDYAIYANFPDTVGYGKLCGRIEDVEV